MRWSCHNDRQIEPIRPALPPPTAAAPVFARRLSSHRTMPSLHSAKDDHARSRRRRPAIDGAPPAPIARPKRRARPVATEDFSPTGMERTLRQVEQELHARYPQADLSPLAAAFAFAHEAHAGQDAGQR